MKLIKQLLKDGVIISGVELIDNKLYYQIDTGMKSDLKLHPRRNHCYDVKTRYQSSEEVFESTEEVIKYIFFHCLCGRDYMNDIMEELIKKYVPKTLLKERLSKYYKK